MGLIELAGNAIGEQGVEPASSAGPAAGRLLRYVEGRVNENASGYADGTIATVCWRILRYSQSFQTMVMRLGATPAIWRAGDFVVVPVPRYQTMHFVLVALDPALPPHAPVRSERLEVPSNEGDRAFETWSEQMSSAMSATHRFSLVNATDPNVLREFERSQGFFLVVAPTSLAAEYTQRPTPPFELYDAGNPANFSMGVFAPQSLHGPGVTTAAHGVVSGASYTLHDQSLQIDTVTGVTTNAVLDSSFLSTGSTHGLPNPKGNNFLSGVTPNAQIQHDFHGISSGQATAVVSGWVDDLLTIEPWLQNRVFTDPILQGGDSGAALIDANDMVIGFAFYNDPFALTARSAWIWADSVRIEFGL